MIIIWFVFDASVNVCKATFIMPPTLKKLTGHIGFGLSVRSSRTVHARVLKFHIWIPHGKTVEACFFFLSELSPFLELCPFEKSE